MIDHSGSFSIFLLQFAIFLPHLCKLPNTINHKIGEDLFLMQTVSLFRSWHDSSPPITKSMVQRWEVENWRNPWPTNIQQKSKRCYIIHWRWNGNQHCYCSTNLWWSTQGNDRYINQIHYHTRLRYFIKWDWDTLFSEITIRYS